MITFGSTYRIQAANEKQQIAIHNKLDEMSTTENPIEPIAGKNNSLTILMGDDAKLYQGLHGMLKETLPNDGNNREYLSKNLTRIEGALSDKATRINLTA